MIKVNLERDKCIGCGACAAVCPDNWEMADDAKTNFKKEEVEELGCNMDAAKGCPVNCIHLEQEGKKLI